MKKIGESMGFSGGAESTPLVVVSRFNEPGSLHNGDIILIIRQNDQEIQLSPETMKSILNWFKGEC